MQVRKRLVGVEVCVTNVFLPGIAGWYAYGGGMWHVLLESRISTHGLRNRREEMQVATYNNIPP